MSSVPPSQIGDDSRVALARLALDVVSMIPGVAGTDAGPGGLCVTADPPFGVLRGVSVIAQPDGRYEVDLCLVARMVPLLPLADDVRRKVRARAARESLADRLGNVNVEFARALGAGESLVEDLAAEVAVAAPEEPTGPISSQTPPPDPTGVPIRRPGSTEGTTSPYREPRP